MFTIFYTIGNMHPIDVCIIVMSMMGQDKAQQRIICIIVI
jgi:hypothetical protein